MVVWRHGLKMVKNMSQAKDMVCFCCAFNMLDWEDFEHIVV